MTHIVTIASVDDARYIASRLRDEDRREVDALTALPPEVILPQIVAAARTTYCFKRGDGEPIGVFGVEPTPIPFHGTVWCLTTSAILHHKVEFLRASRHHLDLLHTDYSLLSNLVDARNTQHIKWLRWLGFSFLRKVNKWGARSVPFYEFARIKPCA